MAASRAPPSRARARAPLVSPRGGGDGVRAGRGGVGVLFAECSVADGAHAHARGDRAANVHHREARGADAQQRKRRKRLLLAPEERPDATQRARGARARDGVQLLSGGGGHARNAGWRGSRGDLGASDRRARLRGHNGERCAGPTSHRRTCTVARHWLRSKRMALRSGMPRLSCRRIAMWC